LIFGDKIETAHQKLPTRALYLDNIGLFWLSWRWRLEAGGERRNPSINTSYCGVNCCYWMVIMKL